MLSVSPSSAAAAGTRSPRSGGGGAILEGHGVPGHQHALRRPGRPSSRSCAPRSPRRPPAARRSRSWPASPGVGKTRLLGELERAARADGMRVIGGDCVELGEGELPYAPIVGALRPLARAGDPAFAAALRRPPAARWRRSSPGLGTSEPRRRRGDRAGAPVRRPARAARAARGRGRPAGHDRGPALGRPLDARLPRLPGAARCAASACWSSPPTARTSCTAATRCARCWPSSSATPAPAASSSSR